MEANNSKYNIVCLSNQLWDYPIWTNKKHVMTRLAKLGHNVMFIDPPVNVGRLFFRHLFSGRWDLIRLLTLQYFDSDVRVFSPLNLFYVPTISSKFYSFIINKISRLHFNPDLKTILWIYHVELKDLHIYVGNIQHDLLIYDCVDNYAGFPKYDTKEKKDWINNQEKEIVEKADIVFASAPNLVEKLSKYNNNVYYAPNVGDYEKFKDVRNHRENIPNEMKDIPRPIVGFTGALDDYKFDKNLVKRISENHPNVSFVLIGPMALRDREAKLHEIEADGIKNVYLLGSRPFSEIQNYFSGFDAFMIPYQLTDYTVGGCFPIKFHDALAAGLPTVVTDLPAYEPFRDVCYISKSYEEFSSNIRKALDEDNDKKIKEREEVAKKNDWNEKVAYMLLKIGEMLE